jgi:hypothetical protein
MKAVMAPFFMTNGFRCCGSSSAVTTYRCPQSEPYVRPYFQPSASIACASLGRNLALSDGVTGDTSLVGKGGMAPRVQFAHSRDAGAATHRFGGYGVRSIAARSSCSIRMTRPRPRNSLPQRGIA